MTENAVVAQCGSPMLWKIALGRSYHLIDNIQYEIN